jgi:hypothetical protein
MGSTHTQTLLKCHSMLTSGKDFKVKYWISYVNSSFLEPLTLNSLLGRGGPELVKSYECGFVYESKYKIVD